MTRLTIPISLLLVGLALLLSFWTRIPAPDLIGLTALACALLTAQMLAANAGLPAHALAAGAGWLSTVVLAGLLVAAFKPGMLDAYFAVVAWLMAAAIALTAKQISSSRSKAWWKALGFVWAFVGSAIWLIAAYVHDVAASFYVGLLLALIVIIWCKRACRLPTPAVLSLNTLILFLMLLPLVDWITRPKPRADPHPEVAGNSYLFEVGSRDRDAFLYWWGRYLKQYDHLMKDLFVPDPARILPYRVRTNADTTFFQSRIHINGLGFRGKEISADKGDTYRIVALGESTTFGFTLTPDHKPWPEVLEQLIQERLKPARPVEVINAGLPHHNLRDNLYRLQKDILQLQPDLILSCHGWNGFQWLWPSLPPVFERHAPVFKHRPSRLLAESEYRVKLLYFRKRLAAKPISVMPNTSKVLATQYAEAYRELIGVAHTNRIRLAIANYSMAVNSRSEHAVIEFYHAAFPSVYALIQVNQLHSMLVRELCQEHPEVCLVDTQPGLDGEHQKFIDLVHFAPDGDRQMAESFFTAIKPVLERDLAVPHVNRP